MAGEAEQEPEAPLLALRMESVLGDMAPLDREAPLPPVTVIRREVAERMAAIMKVPVGVLLGEEEEW